MSFDRDGFANGEPVIFQEDLSEIRFMLENRTGDKHNTELKFAGLSAGLYSITIDNTLFRHFEAAKGNSVILPIENKNKYEIIIEKIRRPD